MENTVYDAQQLEKYEHVCTYAAQVGKQVPIRNNNIVKPCCYSGKQSLRFNKNTNRSVIGEETAPLFSDKPLRDDTCETGSFKNENDFIHFVNGSKWKSVPGQIIKSEIVRTLQRCSKNSSVTTTHLRKQISIIFKQQ